MSQFCYAGRMPDASLTLPRTKDWSRVLLFACFAAITLAPLTMIHAQWLTGPLVNAMLLLTCVLVGPMEAVILGLFPSPTALVSGLLPLPLAAMLPFIMIGNALYVATFFGLQKRSMIIGIVAASLVKDFVLPVSSHFLSATLLPASAVPLASVMMGVMQGVTALAGGAIALVLLSFIRRRA